MNRVFDTPNLYSGMENLVAVYVYSLELYYDFSGYTDIARGCGLLLGVRLPINFDRPYTSVNMADFWRRWHITFSNWLRDYLYFSLPGKRTRIWPYLNLSHHHGSGRIVARHHLAVRHLGPAARQRPGGNPAAGRPGADAVPKPAWLREPSVFSALTSLSVSPGYSSAARLRPSPSTS